jgi:hypothetical protein
MSWGNPRRPKIRYGVISFPNAREGSDGDIQIRETNLGAKLFGKVGGKWYGQPLTATEGAPITRIGVKLSNHLAISSDKLEFIKDSVSMLSITSDGDINLNGQINLTSKKIGGADGGNVVIGIRNSNKGQYNVLLGYEAGKNIADLGSNYAEANVCIGGNTGQNLTAQLASAMASENVFIGVNAGKAAVSSRRNVAIGSGAMDTASSSSENVIIGYRAGEHADFEGNRNIFLGLESADTITTGENNICIGYLSDGAAAVDEQIAIGHAAVCTGQYGISIGDGTSAASDHMVIGRAGAGNYWSIDFTSSTTWAHSSDLRMKRNIQDDTLGLSFINDLKTKTFQYKSAEEFPEEWGNYTIDENDNKKYPKMHDKVMHGMIAQDVKAALDKADVDTFGAWMEDEKGIQRLASGDFVYPLIKSVQELSAKIDTMQTEINNLKAE